MLKKLFDRRKGLLALLVGGSALVTAATCDPVTGAFNFFRNDDNYDDYYYDGGYYDGYYYDDYYYDDCYYDCF